MKLRVFAAIAILISLLASTIYVGFAREDRLNALPPVNADAITWVESAHRVAIAQVGEDPNLAGVAAQMPLRFCDGSLEGDHATLDAALSLMNATEEGKELYQLLYESGLCVRAEQLPYNSGYTRMRWSDQDGWTGSEIVLDVDVVDHLYPDVLAAVLVHEAEHARRAVSGSGCYFVDACHELDNGIELEEEIAAHGAESRWWIEIYGDNGKRFAFRSDHGMNELAEAWNQGESAFANYVEQLRSDQREGNGARS